MGGEPNQFCSCGVNDQIANIGTIQYIAFVDSTTDVPVLGFEQFAIDQNASDAWGNVDSDYDWNGFVAEVNESGLIAGQAIKLWIRMDMYDEVTFEGITFDPCLEPEYFTKSELFPGAIGTDEWNEADSQLALDHLGIAYFINSNISLSTVDEGELSYYDDIIESFFLSLEEGSFSGISVFPIPSKESIRILGLTNIPHFAMVYDSRGRLVYRDMLYEGQLNIAALDKGLYFLRFEDQQYGTTLRFVKD